MAMAARKGRTLVFALLGCLGGAPPLQSSTQDVVRAANNFLSTLNESQRHRVEYAYDDAAQRARWSNLPTGFVPRGGISLEEMTAPQRSAALELLKAVLSPAGYVKVNQIRMADDDFKVNGSKRGPRGSGPPGISGGPPERRPPPRGSDMFGSDLYYLSFLGAPSMTKPWMLQFGGHHLALNITMAGAEGVMTPSLTGAQPATFKVNDQTIRPLGKESDKALALLRSLDTKQREQAVLRYRVPDLVLGPGQDGKSIEPEGLKASNLEAKQQAALLDLIGEWVGIVAEPAASSRMAQLRADLDETWFAWSGPTAFESGDNITAYYRIQGPHLVIEYAPQSDEPANHIHTIYRDPTNDYGRRLDHANL
jgi:hypothetical protein